MLVRFAGPRIAAQAIQPVTPKRPADARARLRVWLGRSVAARLSWGALKHSMLSRNLSVFSEIYKGHGDTGGCDCTAQSSHQPDPTPVGPREFAALKRWHAAFVTRKQLGQGQIIFVSR